jgi:polysaccharide biosynthesis/export protein
MIASLRPRCRAILGLMSAFCLSLALTAAETGDASSSNSPATATNSLFSLPPLHDPRFSEAAMSVLDNQQKLGVGDQVSFRVIEDQEDAKSLTVNESGDLLLPYIGLVSARDRTCRELAKEAKTLLEKDHYYRATVIMSVELVSKRKGSTRKIYVIGHVRTPGAQEIPEGGPYTVGMAILQAGGFTDFADKKKVRLMRKGGVNGVPEDGLRGGARDAIIVNVAEIWEKGKRQNDIVVGNEDLIYVPGRLFNF